MLYARASIVAVSTLVRGLTLENVSPSKAKGVVVVGVVSRQWRLEKLSDRQQISELHEGMGVWMSPGSSWSDPSCQQTW